MNTDEKTTFTSNPQNVPELQRDSGKADSVWFTRDMNPNCIEGGCTGHKSFEKGAKCQCVRQSDEQKSLWDKLVALLTFTGLLVWNIPKLLLPRSWSSGRIRLTDTPEPNVHSAVSTGYKDLEARSDFTKTFVFKDLQTFTLKNLIKPTRQHERFTNSFVHLLQGKDQKDDIVVDFNFKTSAVELQKLLDIQQTQDSLIINFPTEQTGRGFGFHNCIETQTKIFVREGLKLKAIDIHSIILGITIPSKINLQTYYADLRCVAGTIEATPFFQSRETVIKVDTGQIKGTYALYDLLDMSNEAGAIRAEVLSRPADENAVKPARINAATNSGAIRIVSHSDEVYYDRDYQTNVSTGSGAIDGSFNHGSVTSLSTLSGAITANILPYAADRASELTTTTRSGRQVIKVLTPFKSNDKPLNQLESTHRSHVGAVNVHYPRAWEGTVQAVTTTGSASVSGPDLHVIKSSKPVIGKYIEARKGKGDATTLCRTETGAVTFIVEQT